MATKLESKHRFFRTSPDAGRCMKHAARLAGCWLNQHRVPEVQSALTNGLVLQHLERLLHQCFDGRDVELHF